MRPWKCPESGEFVLDCGCETCRPTRDAFTPKRVYVFDYTGPVPDCYERIGTRRTRSL